ncbi:hypothetical protein NXV73_13525 [Bacteroides salyersiae]|nr:hypothetical protein [Bacteroides salyersiae]
MTSLENIGYEGDNTVVPVKPVNVNLGSVSESALWNNISSSK